MANQKPLRYNPSTGGFILFQGDDNFWLNYTDSSGNILNLQKSSTDVFVVDNDGAVDITVTGTPSNPALRVQGLPASSDILNLYDSNAGSDVASITKTTVGSSWATDFGSDAPNHADAIGLRLIHKTESATPLGEILTIGNTNASSVFQERFRFENGGAMYLSAGSGANVLWVTDGAGNIGGSSDNRPANIYSELTVTGGGTTIKDNEIEIGPTAATNKTITALQTGSDDPVLRYDSGTSKWQFSNNGTSFSNIGDDAASSWDDIYANDQTLTIDQNSAPLAFTQTSTAGSGFTVTRNLTSANTDSAIVAITNSNTGDDQASLLISGKSVNVLDVELPSVAPTANVNVQKIDITSAGITTASIDVNALYISASDHANDVSSVDYRGLYLIGSSAGPATKYGIVIDSNWNESLWANSRLTIDASNATQAARIAQNSSGSILNLIDGTVSSGTTRWSFSETGEATVTPASTVPALDIDGARADYLVEVSNTNATLDNQYAITATGRISALGTTATTIGGGGVFNVITSVARSTGTGIGASDNFVCFYASAEMDADDNSSSVWCGFQAVASASAGSDNKYAFSTGGTWDYLLSGIGKVDQSWQVGSLSVTTHYMIDTTFTSDGSTGNPTLVMHRIDLNDHASDAMTYYGTVYETTAESDSVKTAIDINVDWDVGIDSTAGYHYLERTNGKWTGTGVNLLRVFNLNTASDTKGAIHTKISQTTSGIWCLQLENTAQSSTTEGTRYHLGFTAAKTNTRDLSIFDFQPDQADDVNGGDYYLTNAGIGGSHNSYWLGRSVDNNLYMAIPLRLPHACTLSTVRVYQYGGAGTASGTDLPAIALYRKAYGASTATLIGSVAYASSTGTATITLSPSHTLDNSSYAYWVQYRNVATGRLAAARVYGCQVEYTISDLGAAPGF